MTTPVASEAAAPTLDQADPADALGAPANEDSPPEHLAPAAAGGAPSGGEPGGEAAGTLVEPPPKAELDGGSPADGGADSLACAGKEREEPEAEQQEQPQAEQVQEQPSDQPEVRDQPAHEPAQVMAQLQGLLGSALEEPPNANGDAQQDGASASEAPEVVPAGDDAAPAQEPAAAQPSSGAAPPGQPALPEQPAAGRDEMAAQEPEQVTGGEAEMATEEVTWGAGREQEAAWNPGPPLKDNYTGSDGGAAEGGAVPGGSLSDAGQGQAAPLMPTWSSEPPSSSATEAKAAARGHDAVPSASPSLANSAMDGSDWIGDPTAGGNPAAEEVEAAAAAAAQPPSLSMSGGAVSDGGWAGAPASEEGGGTVGARSSPLSVSGGWQPAPTASEEENVEMSGLGIHRSEEGHGIHVEQAAAELEIPGATEATALSMQQTLEAPLMAGIAAGYFEPACANCPACKGKHVRHICNAAPHRRPRQPSRSTKGALPGSRPFVRENRPLHSQRGPLAPPKPAGVSSLVLEDNEPSEPPPPADAGVSKSGRARKRKQVWEPAEEVVNPRGPRRKPASVGGGIGQNLPPEEQVWSPNGGPGPAWVDLGVPMVREPPTHFPLSQKIILTEKVRRVAGGCSAWWESSGR